MSSLAARGLATTLAFATAIAAPALGHAEVVSAPPDAERQCSAVSGDMIRWTPADGLPVRFITEAFTRGGGERWIGLGYDADGFWSAESGAGSDACDSCDGLDLVLTRFDGTRHRHPVVTFADRQRLEGQPPGALGDLTRARLWHLAATVWPVTSLRQDYLYRVPPGRDADGVARPFTGWMSEAAVRGSWLLRFGVHATPFMCWCHSEWRGWALAKK